MSINLKKKKKKNLLVSAAFVCFSWIPVLVFTPTSGIPEIIASEMHAET